MAQTCRDDRFPLGPEDEADDDWVDDSDDDEDEDEIDFTGEGE